MFLEKGSPPSSGLEKCFLIGTGWNTLESLNEIRTKSKLFRKLRTGSFFFFIIAEKPLPGKKRTAAGEGRTHCNAARWR